MKRLIPRPLPLDPLPESARAALDRLITVAAAAGYVLDRDDAATLWRRHSANALCSSWIKPGTDQDILAALLAEADTLELPDPPTGYASWLDYAVACMDTRSAELEHLLSDEAPPATREQMDQAVAAELAQLRARVTTPLVLEAVARMQNVPRFFSANEWTLLASYEGPVVSGSPGGKVPDDLANDDNE